jgi:AraC family transcriptional regulator of adaptative response/methylated-DNA-[protein]-cysteine methyltransferase
MRKERNDFFDTGTYTVIIMDSDREHAINFRDYRRIESAISLMKEEYPGRIDSRTVAMHLGISEFHFRRLFRRWAGIPPERFIRYLAKEHALALIRDSASYLESSLEAGFSGPGRFAEACLSFEAMTPHELRTRGEGMVLRWGTGDTPFGRAVLVTSERGITDLAFLQDELLERPLEAVRGGLERANYTEDREMVSGLLHRIFSETDEKNQVLHLRGTNFQIKVWEALLRLPFGGATDYGSIAAALGNPGAARAVGSAVGKNHVAWLIPCHRVIRSIGESGDYRWGAFRKQCMLAWEAARLEQMLNRDG